jgi:hypothetical protein
VIAHVRVTFRRLLPQPPQVAAKIRNEDRASGEEAVHTVERITAESTPSGMPRLKSERL